MAVFPCAAKPDTRRVNLFTNDGKVPRAGAGAKEPVGEGYSFHGYENGCRGYMGTFGAKESGSCAIPHLLFASVNRPGKQPAVVKKEAIDSDAEVVGCWVMLRNITNIKHSCLMFYPSSMTPIRATYKSNRWHKIVEISCWHGR